MGRKAYMRKTGPTLRYCTNQGAFWMSYSAVFAYASVFLLARSFTNREIGLVVAAGSAFSAIVQPRIGAFADSRRRCILHRLITVVSLAMIVLAGLLLTVAKTFWIIALLYGLLVAFLQLNTPLTYSLCMFFVNKGVPINFGIARGFGSLMYAVLSTVLGRLVDRYSADLIMYAVILVYILLIISTVTFHFQGIDEDNPVSAENTGESERKMQARGRKSLLLANPRFALVLSGSVCLFVSHNIISNYIYQIVSYHGYSSSEMGMTISIAAILEIPILFSFDLINRRFASGTLLKICGLFFTLRSLILLLAGNLTMIYLAQLAQPFGYGLYVGASVYYVNHTISEEHRVEGQAYMTLTCSVGAVIGSLLGGWLLDMFSVPGLLTFGTGVGALGAFVIILTGEKGKCREEQI